ncbi:DUF2933 domain-containing protein [Ruegeria pomeroyi]|uniref:DUF2933 domain-containing protein n=2 Tax=Ruegeria pomeroyi TaxID=89184 RepID=A0A850LI91_9RHOB|nr:DUF2933 domain-containing protein [Ruegeria pomeroyi]NVK97824.1 DUF2933 domain-containing protein [Ruegeria pomeroyi]
MSLTRKDEIMTPRHAPRAGGTSWLARWGMLACCVAMLAPLAILLIAGTSLTGLAGNLWILLPLAACLGLHVVMHRMTGRSCHTAETDGETDMSARPKT